MQIHSSVPNSRLILYSKLKITYANDRCIEESVQTKVSGILCCRPTESWDDNINNAWREIQIAACNRKLEQGAKIFVL